ncbi:hypothetical protein OX451_07240 [Citrobacter portucalensis]|uniref:hypothetical protein n=1 Tax=Citrobacter portucalensis TaxID=1639133 RepID=UPI00237C324B|nr:hypothetical protein [Citrobacter portucalensis]MDQ9156343.1 hypothetical protein [Citrobacter portucalensis]MEB1055223.1 hypothetical protein [Citrobacter portucalensis]
MFGSMQKTHECDVFYHLGRPVISQRPVIQRWMSGRGRWVKKHVNVKNEGIMQKNESPDADVEYHLREYSGMMLKTNRHI